MATNWYDNEDRTRRRVRRIRIGRIYTRVYNVPKDSASTVEGTSLVRGTVMPGVADTVLAPRVKNISYGQPNDRGVIQVRVDYIQPEAY